MKLGPLEMTLKSRELKLLNDGNMTKSKITENGDFSKSRKKKSGFFRKTTLGNVLKKCTKFHQARTTKSDFKIPGTEITERWKYG